MQIVELMNTTLQSCRGHIQEMHGLLIAVQVPRFPSGSALHCTATHELPQQIHRLVGSNALDVLNLD
jgi:hypothetical protein